MLRPIWRTVMAAAIVLSIVPAQRADAFRRGRSYSSDCCQPCQYFHGIPRDCLRSKVVDEGNGVFLYYADYYESTCGQDAQPDAWEGGEEAIPEVCPPGSPACKNVSFYGPGSGNFKGLHPTHPTDPDQDCCWSPCTKECGKHYECLWLCGECRAVKVQVVDRWIPGICECIHVALEVSQFPEGVNPCTICVCGCNCNKCKHCDHAWSLRYCGKKVLLLTQ